MNSDIDSKLAVLRKTYQDSLPDKIIEINALMARLNDHWEKSNIVEFHRKIHSLHGSSNIYGFNEIGLTAKKLENALSGLIDDPVSTKKESLSLLFSELQDKMENAKYVTKETHIDTDIVSTVESNHIIYLLENDKAWEEKLISQVKPYGYDMKSFEDSVTLIKHLELMMPAALCLNIHGVDDRLDRYIVELKGNLATNHIPLLYTANSGDFSSRLKAVRLYGQAYLLKPFAAEDLLGKIDYYYKLENQVYKILIVDDEFDAANYYSSILENANMKTKIITASSELEHALHHFKPDLILMDLYMPDCSGLELAAIIRQQSAYESIPIIFLSSEEDKLKQLNAMRQGADDFITKSIKPNFLILTVRNRADRYKTLRSMMVEDSLTGIYNHSFILQQLLIEMKSASRSETSLCVSMIDLDKFKSINDSYNHLAGDQVLRSLSLLMRKRLRATDIVGRYGGEEFLVILPHTDLQEAKIVINELREQFSKLVFSSGGQLFSSTFSAGIAVYPVHSSPAALIEAADKALYSSKDQGRNRVEG